MIKYVINPDVDNEVLNALFSDAWSGHAPRDFKALLSHSLGYVCAVTDGELVGFANIAWDGGAHAFLLDPTVRSDYRRQGIGTGLVREAVGLASSKGVEWLHVDYEPSLAEFYAKCGFRKTESGLINLKNTGSSSSAALSDGPNS